MTKFRSTLLAGALALALASGNAAAQFDNMIFLGDSLTDGGFYGARFTVNPGLVWAQDLGLQYGFTIKPITQGGTDFAQGGQRVTQPSASTPPGAPQRPLSTQIDELLRGTPSLNPNSLYAVWIGGNDLLQNLSAAQQGVITPAQAAAAMVTAGAQTAQQLARLNAAGARYIIVWNLPDAGKSPAGMAAGPAGSAAATAFAGLFNSTLNASIPALGFQVVPLDAFRLVNEIIAAPAAYGFTNVTGVACTTPSSITCTPATLVSPNAASTYLFADGVHPTPAAHAILAQYAASVLQGPQQMGALAEAPLAVEQANWRALDGRMISGLNSPRAQGKFEAWVAYDYSNPDQKSSFFDGNGDVNTVVVGGDMKLSDKLLIGIAIGYSDNKSDFGNVGYTLREPMGTFYLGYGDGPWYLGATLGAGSLDISTHRDIALGAATRTESGDTHGYQTVGRVLGGYWFKAGDIVHGPTVKLTFQDIVVRQFQENGTASTTLDYGQQNRHSFITSAGWQIAGNWGGVRPYARATWEYESRSDQRNVSASVYGLNGTFSMPAYKPDNNYGLFNIGAATEFGKVTGFVTGTATAGKGDGDYFAVTVGIRVPL